MFSFFLYFIIHEFRAKFVIKNQSPAGDDIIFILEVQ